MNIRLDDLNCNETDIRYGLGERRSLHKSYAPTSAQNFGAEMTPMWLKFVREECLSAGGKKRRSIPARITRLTFVSLSIFARASNFQHVRRVTTSRIKSHAT